MSQPSQPVQPKPFEAEDSYLTPTLAERFVQAVELPYPPSINTYWRIFVNPKTHVPRMVVTSDGARYKKEAQRIARTCGLSVLKGEIRIRFDVYRPRKIGDLDNTIKVTQDALSGIAFTDDSQIVFLEAHRHDDKLRPRVEVTVEGDLA